MKVLTKDEKAYIYKEVLEKISKLLSIEDETILKNRMIEEVSNNEVIKSIKTFVESIYSKELVETHTSIVRSYSGDKAKFCINIRTGNDFYLDQEVPLSTELLKALDERKELVNRKETLRQEYLKNVEKYYITFSTWKGTSSERLDKINELIDLICFELGL